MKVVRGQRKIFCKAWCPHTIELLTRETDYAVKGKTSENLGEWEWLVRGLPQDAQKLGN